MWLFPFSYLRGHNVARSMFLKSSQQTKHHVMSSGWAVLFVITLMVAAIRSQPLTSSRGKHVFMGFTKLHLTSISLYPFNIWFFIYLFQFRICGNVICMAYFFYCKIISKRIYALFLMIPANNQFIQSSLHAKCFLNALNITYRYNIS